MRIPLLAIAVATTATIAPTASAQTTPPPPPAPAQGDATGDGLMTKAEWQARSAERFDRLDTNHDGVLDKDERAAMRDQRFRRPGGGRPPAPADY